MLSIPGSSGSVSSGSVSSDENVSIKTPLELANKCQIEGNVEMMRYHLLLGARANDSECAMRLSSLYAEESNDKMSDKYLIRAMNLKNILAHHTVVKHMLADRVIQGISIDPCRLIELVIFLIHHDEDITIYVDNIYDKIGNLKFISDNGDNTKTCGAFIRRYISMKKLMAAHGNYSPKALLQLMKVYEYLINPNEMKYRWYMIRDTWKMVGVICEEYQESNLGLKQIRAVVVRLLKEEINYVLGTEDYTTIQKIRDFCWATLDDGKLHIEATRILGTLYNKKWERM
jgi:hypothetical protein